MGSSKAAKHRDSPARTIAGSSVSPSAGIIMIAALLRLSTSTNAKARLGSAARKAAAVPSPGIGTGHGQCRGAVCRITVRRP